MVTSWSTVPVNSHSEKCNWLPRGVRYKLPQLGLLPSISIPVTRSPKQAKRCQRSPFTPLGNAIPLFVAPEAPSAGRSASRVAPRLPPRRATRCPGCGSPAVAPRLRLRALAEPTLKAVATQLDRRLDLSGRAHGVRLPTGAFWTRRASLTI